MPIEKPQSGAVPPLIVRDFSGGITDNFIDAPINQAREYENFLITDNKKPNTRPGTVVYDVDNPQTPAGNNPITGFITTKDNFLQVAGRNLYSQASGIWATLQGPSGNAAIPPANLPAAPIVTELYENFIQPYSSDSGFTYDSGKAEFFAGTVQQKINTDVLFHVNFQDSDYDAEIAGGSPTGVDTGPFNIITTIDASLKNRLGGSSETTWAAPGNYNKDIIAFACWYRFDTSPGLGPQFILQITGTHTVTVRYTPSSDDFVFQVNHTGGQLSLNPPAGGGITLGVEHWIEAYADVTTGDMYFFVDGVLRDSITGGSTGTRTENPGDTLYSNNSSGAGVGGVSSIDDYTMYNSIQHTTTHSVPTKASTELGVYPESKVDLPTFTYSGVGVLKDVDSIVVSSTGNEKYILDGKYWDGAAWVVSDGSYSQANTVSDVNINAAALTLTSNLQVPVSLVFPNGAAQENADNLKLNYIVDLSGIPVLDPVTCDQIDWDNFDETYMVTSLDYGAPQKIYPDQNGDYQVRTAGLPSVALISSFDLANELKSKYNSHVDDGAIHSGPGGDDDQNAAVSDDADSLSTLLTLTNELLEKYTAHQADALLLVPDHHNATGTDYAPSFTDSATTLDEAIERLDDLKSKYNSHNSDAVAHAFVNLVYAIDASTDTEPVITGTVGTNQYIYTLVAFYEYNVRTIIFKDFGPTNQQLVTLVDAPEVNAIEITGIPVITNGTDQNYDTDNIKWIIYRSENAGTTLYEVGRVDNGTTSYSDIRSDADIVADNIVIYTTGGVLDNDPPPEAKYVTIVNDIAWYGNIREGDEIKKNRMQFSVKFDVDSCPVSFFEDFDEEIVGVESVNIYPIIFCKSKIFRVEGFLDDTGAGFIVKREISAPHGAVNHNSIRNFTDPGTGQDRLGFASDDGFYITDGFNVMKVSDLFDNRYRALVETDQQKKNIFGVYDGINDRVYWAVTQNSASAYNDGFYTFDLDFGVKNEGVFTTLSANSDSWKPTAIAFDHLGNLVIGDSRGYAFTFDESKLTDPKIDLFQSDVTQWLTSAIKYNYVSVTTSGGDPNIRKWLNLLTLNAENKTNISLSPQFDRENSGHFTKIAEIRTRGNITWGDYDVIWQDGTPDQTPVYPWNTFPLIAEKRRFPAGRLRVNYLTIRLTNSETIITNSDTLGTAGVSGTTVTLDPIDVAVWPEDAVDYLIAFEADGYAETYNVKVRDSDTDITVLGAPPVGASQKWHLVGIAKGEAFNLMDYAVNWQPLTPSFIPYRASSSGAND